MDQNKSKTKLVVGAIVAVVGFLSPLAIPLVANSNLSTTIKTGLSGLLALGIPEIFLAIAIAIMGKDGYDWLKSKIGKYLQPLFPPEYVSDTRYNIGLVMFSIPLIVGWSFPYLSILFPVLGHPPVWTYIALDVLFVISFYVLGGQFWYKVSALFKNTSAQ